MKGCSSCHAYLKAINLALADSTMFVFVGPPNAGTKNDLATDVLYNKYTLYTTHHCMTLLLMPNSYQGHSDHHHHHMTIFSKGSHSHFVNLQNQFGMMKRAINQWIFPFHHNAFWAFVQLSIKEKWDWCDTRFKRLLWINECMNEMNGASHWNTVYRSRTSQGASHRTGGCLWGVPWCIYSFWNWKRYTVFSLISALPLISAPLFSWLPISNDEKKSLSFSGKEMQKSSKKRQTFYFNFKSAQGAY